MAGSEKLGRCYGKQALEWEWGYPTALKCDAIDERIEGAVLVRDLGELGELARLRRRSRTLVSPRSSTSTGRSACWSRTWKPPTARRAGQT